MAIVTVKYKASKLQVEALGQNRSTHSRKDTVGIYSGFVIKPDVGRLSANAFMYKCTKHTRVHCMRYADGLEFSDYTSPPRGGSIYDHLNDELTRFKTRQLLQLRRP